MDITWDGELGDGERNQSDAENLMEWGQGFEDLMEVGVLAQLPSRIPMKLDT